MIFDDLVDAVGHTPVVRLRAARADVTMAAKLELQNLFAMKDRVVIPRVIDRPGLRARGRGPMLGFAYERVAAGIFQQAARARRRGRGRGAGHRGLAPCFPGCCQASATSRSVTIPAQLP